MNRYYYDLHVHSCLSPCADDEATPANIAAMAQINGLQIVALTDHNTCQNCPSFFKAAKTVGLIPIAGMELTTAEDIHVICLFPTLESAMDFDRFVGLHRIRIKNKPDVFGHQYLMDEDETVLGEEPDLLINATTLTLEEAFTKCRELNGISYPAHIDRTSNGIIAVLGAFPESPSYTAYELHDANKKTEFEERFPHLRGLCSVVSSDSHELGTVSEAENYFLLDDVPYSSRLVTDNLIRHIRKSTETGGETNG